MLRMMCKNCGCDTFPVKNEKICSCEIVHFKKLENGFLKVKIFIADFTLYMSFLPHMVHTNERAHQDLQKRFFHLKVILQYDFYHRFMPFSVKTVYGFMDPYWSSSSWYMWILKLTTLKNPQISTFTNPFF